MKNDLATENHYFTEIKKGVFVFHSEDFLQLETI